MVYISKPARVGIYINAKRLTPAASTPADEVDALKALYAAVEGCPDTPLKVGVRSVVLQALLGGNLIPVGLDFSDEVVAFLGVQDTKNAWAPSALIGRFSGR